MAHQILHFGVVGLFGHELGVQCPQRGQDALLASHIVPHAQPVVDEGLGGVRQQLAQVQLGQGFVLQDGLLGFLIFGDPEGPLVGGRDLSHSEVLLGLLQTT